MPPPSPYPRRRRPRDPFAGQQLGVRLRRDNQPPLVLKLTLPRQRLMEGIKRGEVSPGTGRYGGGYRWHHGNGDSETVTVRVLELMAAQWAAMRGEKHVDLTDAGLAALDNATKEKP